MKVFFIAVFPASAHAKLTISPPNFVETDYLILNERKKKKVYIVELFTESIW